MAQNLLMMCDVTRDVRGDPSCFASVRLGTPDGDGVAHSSQLHHLSEA